ncbi:hemolysin-III related-domain-containing protein [Usnea florida]
MSGHVRALSASLGDKVHDSAQAITNAGQAAVHKTTTAIQRVVHRDEVPDWMRADPYIRRGYRRQLNSFRACFWSLFYLHNELVNIWSHLLPACVYLLALLSLDFHMFHSDFRAPARDFAICQLYIVCTLICLFLSAIYHCTNAHSEEVSRWFLKLDYLGIVLNIVGTNVSATYFGLYDNRFAQESHMLFIIACSAFVFYALLRDDTDGPRAAQKRYSQHHPRPQVGEYKVADS